MKRLVAISFTVLLSGPANSQAIEGGSSGGSSGGASFANPTGTIGATAVNGSASTAMRSDAAPALAPGAAAANLGFTPPSIAGTPTIGDCVKWSSATQLADVGATCGSGGSGSPGGSNGQLQYNNGGAFGGASGATVSAGIVALTTPNIGAATGTSLTLTPAANGPALVLTPPPITSGTVGFGQTLAGTINDPSAVDGIISKATITCTSCNSGNQLVDWAYNGSQVLKIDGFGSTTTNSLTANGNLSIGVSYGKFSINGQASLTSPATATWQFGSADTSVGQSYILQPQGATAVTNVAGGNITLQAGNSTGTAAAASILFKSPKQDGTSSGTTAQTQVVGLTVVDGAAKLPSYTVANLPTAANVGAGGEAFVTDATQTMTAGIGATVVGGGSNKVKVYTDGTNWIIG